MVGRSETGSRRTAPQCVVRRFTDEVRQFAIQGLVGFGVALGIAWVVVGLAAAPLGAQQTGRGELGEWELLWRLEASGAEVNRFPVYPDLEFPTRARLVGRGAERRLAFFDNHGRLTGTTALARSESALPSADGSAHLIWSAAESSSKLFEYRYFRSGNPEPDWEASASGEPLLFAPDGSYFVVASADTGRDGFQRAVAVGGHVQVVGAAGDVLGELPILPRYVCCTGDGDRIVMFHPKELVALGADGLLDWNVALPIDTLPRREGISQLEAAGGLIVACGTGETEESSVLRVRRRGTIRVFDDTGMPLWSVDQPESESLWFQPSCALSSDGGTLATFHWDGREISVQAWDARTGERLWRQLVPRRAGARYLSVAPYGEWVVLAGGDLRTYVLAWDREGNVVWDGTLPLAPRGPRIGAAHLLASEQWIVRLTPEF